MNLFVAAYPRSGTTYLAKVLVKELGIYSSPESHFLFSLYREIQNKKIIEKHLLESILKQHFKFRVWEIEPELPDSLHVDNFLSFYENIMACYNQVSIEKVKANVTVDHTPENMINQTHIQKFFPDSIQLHLIRDPRAVFASLKFVNWGPNNVLTFIESWGKSEIAWQAKPAGINVFDIKFDDLVVDSAPIIEKLKPKLGAFTGDPNAKFILPNYTRKQHKLVNSGKGDFSRIDAWKSVLSKREIKLLEGNELIRTYLINNEYEIVSQGCKPNTLEKVAARPLDKVLKGVNRIKRVMNGDKY
ncbi:sulfotransferase [Paraglaciecola aquimarina]|uniref:Sulfotransferase n=1 Tax=Paraglaciecola algarum TaxID=3050085 RepID=A0ABS9D4B0_9ALTE|nr:sulfotransferase [Paraglaciecola sp. G1-23]MCF2947759.1 sulfotransferase [Paraglaciecola sp. G1-23]